jgi:hypothetical protein
MARDSFLLRIDPKIMAAIRQWSEDEVRSVNSQIEYLLRNALKQAGRLPKSDQPDQPAPKTQDDTPSRET